jgi:hypothetical protein
VFQAGNDLFSAFSVFKTSVRSDLRARIDSSSWDPFRPFSGKFTLLFACYSLFYSLFIAFRPIYTMLTLICRNSDDFSTDYVGFRRDKAESQGGGGGGGSGKMMDFLGFPPIFDGF